MILAATCAAPACSADAAGPEWLRAPHERGPVAAALAVDEHHAWWGIDGTLPLSFGSPATRASDMRQPVLGLGLSLAGSAASDSRGLRYTALLDRRNDVRGGWLGISTGAVDGPNAKLRLGTGFWRAFAPIDVEAGVVSSMVDATTEEVSRWLVRPDSLHSHDTTTVREIDRSDLATTGQGALRWHMGRMELTAMGGVTVGRWATPQRWAQASMHFHASKSVLLMAALGQRPAASLAFDPVARPNTMLGVRVAPWAPRDAIASHPYVAVAHEWRTRALTDGRTDVRLRCPHAARVELTADFTDWAPVELHASDFGWWETRLAIPPGLHQVQIRLDGGAWQAPPGLPRTEREFAGEAGVLVVE